jgi:hypothetical protein
MQDHQALAASPGASPRDESGRSPAPRSCQALHLGIALSPGHRQAMAKLHNDVVDLVLGQLTAEVLSGDGESYVGSDQ